MKYVIDGTNVCWWGGECLIANILSLVIEILRNNDDFYCIFDASTPHKLKNNKEVLIFNNLLKKYPDKFTMVTGATRADYPVLVYASEESLKVISNDRYRDYYLSFPWLEKDSHRRLIKANVLEGGLISIEGFGHGFFKLSHDNDSSYEKIKKSLSEEGKSKGANSIKKERKIIINSSKKGVRANKIASAKQIQRQRKLETDVEDKELNEYDEIVAKLIGSLDDYETTTQLLDEYFRKQQLEALEVLEAPRRWAEERRIEVGIGVEDKENNYQETMAVLIERNGQKRSSEQV